MFVSSYNTYISTNNSDRTAKSREANSKENSTFSYKSFETPKTESANTLLPVDYISKSKTFNNKLELEFQKEQLQNKKEDDLAKTKDLTKSFANINTLQSAKKAYVDNSKIFSFIKIPHPSLDQTTKIDKALPENIKELKEQNMRNIMVNTYIQNDRYYQITA